MDKTVELKRLRRQNKQYRAKLKALKPQSPALDTSMKELEDAASKAAALKPQPIPETQPGETPPSKKKGNWLFGTTKPKISITSSIPVVKKVSGRRMWLFWPGLVSLAIAVLIFIGFLKDPSNQFLAILFVVIGGFGGAMAWFGIKKREEGVKFIDPKKPAEKPFKGLANCLNIYYRKDKKGKVECDRIVFEKLPDETLAKMKEEGRLGKYQRFRNDGNYYFVHGQDPDDGMLYPLRLPDTVYFSPRELINVVTMPASHKYAKPKSTMMDKLKPAMLLIGIGIIALLMVVTNGSPKPEGNNPTVTGSIQK